MKPEFVIARIQDKWRNLQARQPVELPDGEKPSALDAKKHAELDAAELPVLEQDNFSIHMPLQDELLWRLRYWKLLWGLAWDRFRGRR